MRLLVVALIAGSVPVDAYAYESLPSDNGPLVRFSAPIESATWDGAIKVNYNGQPLRVALGIPSKLKSRGLPLSALTTGAQVTLDTYRTPGDETGSLRAERIVIDGRAIDLR